MKVDFVRADHVGVDFEEIDLVGKPKDVCDMQSERVHACIHTWKESGEVTYSSMPIHIYTSV